MGKHPKSLTVHQRQGGGKEADTCRGMLSGDTTSSRLALDLFCGLWQSGTQDALPETSVLLQATRAGGSQPQQLQF